MSTKLLLVSNSSLLCFSFFSVFIFFRCQALHMEELFYLLPFFSFMPIIYCVCKPIYRHEWKYFVWKKLIEGVKISTATIFSYDFMTLIKFFSRTAMTLLSGLQASFSSQLDKVFISLFDYSTTERHFYILIIIIIWLML